MIWNLLLSVLYLAFATSPVREAQDLYFRGVEERTNGSDRARSTFEEGHKILSRALVDKPQDPELLFWWAAHLGAEASLQRNLAALGALKKMEGALLLSREENPTYGYAAADRVLGKIYQEAPGVISIGSYAKAESHFLEALRKFPEYPGNWVVWAQYLAARDRKKEAKEVARLLKKSDAYRKNDFGVFSREKKDWERALNEIIAE